MLPLPPRYCLPIMESGLLYEDLPRPSRPMILGSRWVFLEEEIVFYEYHPWRLMVRPVYVELSA